MFFSYLKLLCNTTVFVLLLLVCCLYKTVFYILFFILKSIVCYFEIIFIALATLRFNVFYFFLFPVTFNDVYLYLPTTAIPRFYYFSTYYKTVTEFLLFARIFHLRRFSWTIFSRKFLRVSIQYCISYIFIILLFGNDNISSSDVKPA